MKETRSWLNARLNSVVRTESGERDMEGLAGKSVAAIQRSQILHDSGGEGRNGNI